MGKMHEVSPEYLREVLKHVVEMSSFLSRRMDRESFLRQIVETYCQALQFCTASLYLADGTSFFRLAASTGISVAEENYLREHPVPANILACIIDEDYRVSDSYFLPVDSSLWRDEQFSSYFSQSVIPSELSGSRLLATSASSSGDSWRDGDFLLIPLVSLDNYLLGFFLPSDPLDGQRPTGEEIALYELFTNQAAALIESAAISSELREIVRQARESERANNNFLMLASHELRTPLTAVQGYLELLGDYGETLDGESKAHFIQNARRSCDELVLLLGNVLDLTHLDVEKMVFHSSPVYPGRSAQLILAILEPILVREARPVDICISEDLCAWADELRLRQILLNVLGNALKYTPAGSRIALSGECMEAERLLKEISPRERENRGLPEHAAGTFIVVTVRDWGLGIPPEKQGLLFTKFTRLEAARKSTQQGAGLGLYLCRQLIGAMSGFIWIESSGVPGEGAAFRIALPMYQP